MPRKKTADQTAETPADAKSRVRVTPQGESPVKPQMPEVVATMPAAATSESPKAKTAASAVRNSAAISKSNAEAVLEQQVLNLAYLSDLLVKHQIPPERTVEFIALMKKANFHEDPAKRIDIAMVERTRFYIDVDPKKVLAKDLKMIQKGLRQYIIQVDDAFERFMEEAKRTLNSMAPANVLTIESLQDGRNTVDDLLKQFEQTRQYHLSQAKSDKGRRSKPKTSAGPQVKIEKV